MRRIVLTAMMVAMSVGLTPEGTRGEAGCPACDRLCQRCLL